jgi:hypothetical protein
MFGRRLGRTGGAATGDAAPPPLLLRREAKLAWAVVPRVVAGRLGSKGRLSFATAGV